MNKELLRKKYIEIRKNIKEKDKKSIAISQRIIQEDTYKNAKVIAIYKSLKEEVDTSYLIEDALSKGKVVLLPKVIGNDLQFFKYDLGDELIKNKFGVYEPIDLKIYSNDKIDLCIVPGVAFDKNNNRLRIWKRIL